MDKLVTTKKLASKMVRDTALTLEDMEKLEKYEKQTKLNAKEAKLKADFMALDADGDGTISTQEMGKILENWQKHTKYDTTSNTFNSNHIKWV